MQVRSREGDVLRIAAVPVHNAGFRPVHAEVRAAGGALRAVAAVDRAFSRHLVPDGKAGDAAAHLLNHTAPLVARNNGQLCHPGGVIEHLIAQNLRVCAAEPGGRYLDEDLPRAWGFYAAVLIADVHRPMHGNRHIFHTCSSYHSICPFSTTRY